MKDRLWLRVAFLCSLAIVLFASCKSNRLVISNVAYQSIRTNFSRPEKIPEDAKIAVEYFIDQSGYLLAVVSNMTDETMTIDQTKSFLINTDGSSKSYYDPNIKSTSSGSFTSETQGSSINLATIANIFGVTGIGFNTSTTNGGFSSTTLTEIDQPVIHVGPHGKMVMSKRFRISNVGATSCFNQTYIDANSKNSPLKFSVCIQYAFDELGINDKLVTDFYVNSNIIEPVNSGMVGDAFRKIYNKKPDAIAEYLFSMSIDSNFENRGFSIFDDSADIGGIYSSYVSGVLLDYK